MKMYISAYPTQHQQSQREKENKIHLHVPIPNALLGTSYFALFSLREAYPDLQVAVCETRGAESVDLWLE